MYFCISSCSRKNNIQTCWDQWRFWGFHLGGHWGGDTFIWGHTTNTVALNYRVCNRLYQIIHIILVSGALSWTFLGATGGHKFHWGAAAPLAPLGTAPGWDCVTRLLTISRRIESYESDRDSATLRRRCDTKGRANIKATALFLCLSDNSWFWSMDIKKELRGAMRVRLARHAVSGRSVAMRCLAPRSQ